MDSIFRISRQWHKELLITFWGRSGSPIPEWLFVVGRFLLSWWRSALWVLFWLEILSGSIFPQVASQNTQICLILVMHWTVLNVVASFSFWRFRPLEIQQILIIQSFIQQSKLWNWCWSRWFIKLASHVLADPLSGLLNLSLSTFEVYLSWKCDKVGTLVKGGDPLNLINYRPISII